MSRLTPSAFVLPSLPPPSPTLSLPHPGQDHRRRRQRRALPALFAWCPVGAMPVQSQSTQGHSLPASAGPASRFPPHHPLHRPLHSLTAAGLPGHLPSCAARSPLRSRTRSSAALLCAGLTRGFSVPHSPAVTSSAAIAGVGTCDPRWMRGGARRVRSARAWALRAGSQMESRPPRHRRRHPHPRRQQRLRRRRRRRGRGGTCTRVPARARVSCLLGCISDSSSPSPFPSHSHSRSPSQTEGLRTPLPLDPRPRPSRLLLPQSGRSSPAPLPADPSTSARPAAP